jgi:glycosyltransferase involved in cell wall biosynthesis
MELAGPGDSRDLAVSAAEKRKAFVRHVREGSLPRIQVISGGEGGSTPSVTIIIPTADGRRGGNLAQLLAQIEQQTFQQFEIILVVGDRRQGRAINLAAAISRGDILLTMDDDTRLGREDLIERIVAAFAADSTIGIAGVSNSVPADAPWVIRRAMRELPRRSSAAVREMTDSDMAEHPCLAIRKEIFYRVGGEHELIPRGLDPYLRREVRRLGYRVVIIPGPGIHHLLPGTLGGILRQYFRNGVGAAYVKKFFPSFIIDQALSHRQVPRDRGLSRRAVRYLGRLAVAFLTLRWIYLGTLISYALGFAWGMRTLAEDSL